MQYDLEPEEVKIILHLLYNQLGNFVDEEETIQRLKNKGDDYMDWTDDIAAQRKVIDAAILKLSKFACDEHELLKAADDKRWCQKKLAMIDDWMKDVDGSGYTLDDLQRQKELYTRELTKVEKKLEVMNQIMFKGGKA